MSKEVGAGGRFDIFLDSGKSIMQWRFYERGAGDIMYNKLIINAIF